MDLLNDEFSRLTFDKECFYMYSEGCYLLFRIIKGKSGRRRLFVRSVVELMRISHTCVVARS